MRYRVYGHTTVNVTVEVEADNKQDAYEIALDTRNSLDAYVGNGGTDKLIGVCGSDECVATDEEIVYDDIELIGD